LNPLAASRAPVDCRRTIARRRSPLLPTNDLWSNHSHSWPLPYWLPHKRQPSRSRQPSREREPRKLSLGLVEHGGASLGGENTPRGPSPGEVKPYGLATARRAPIRPRRRAPGRHDESLRTHPRGLLDHQREDRERIAARLRSARCAHRDSTLISVVPSVSYRSRREGLGLDEHERAVSHTSPAMTIAARPACLRPTPLLRPLLRQPRGWRRRPLSPRACRLNAFVRIGGIPSRQATRRRSPADPVHATNGRGDRMPNTATAITTTAYVVNVAPPRAATVISATNHATSPPAGVPNPTRSGLRSRSPRGEARPPKPA